MKLKILSWNVRGVNESSKRSTIKSLIQKWKVDVLCLQETKVENWSTTWIQQIWGNRWADWATLEASGTRGGIIIIWDKRQWVKTDTLQGSYSISCMLESIQEEFRWCFSGIYGPHTDSEREEMWHEIAGVRGLWDGHWVLGGDFNVCRFESEKLNCLRRTSAMRSFSDTIQDLNLIDLPLQGAQFTWSRGDNFVQASRIDRFLISTEWSDSFKDVKQSALPKVISDHKPILLECGDWDVSPSYFKFENMWLQSEGFLEKLEYWWQSYNIVGRADFVLLQKLKRLKRDITNWNREEFGKVETRKTRALDELAAFEQAAESRQLTVPELIQMMNLRIELQQLVKAEEISWRQKSRCLWLKEGDKNTKFFQKIANSHRRGNCIDKLKVGTEIIEDKHRIKQETVDFYESLYTEPEQWRPSANFEGIPSISVEEKFNLEATFQEEEVLAAIQSCAPDKAPGPDGYTMAFYQKSWDFIKVDILAAMNHYHQHCWMVRSCNASFIALIPKKKGAIELKDYRPISLIGSVYKIIAKVLAERLKTVMGKLVSKHQNAFLKDRQITDASLIVNEVLDWKIKNGGAGILCKLDIEKAFDQLNWSYLLSILRQMGFGERWINWINFNISTVKYSILINRSPVGFFSPQRGLRQGDPLSPFLFILAMEGLSRMLDKAKQLQWLNGFDVGSMITTNISHLLYADDTLIFCEANRSQVLYLNLTLLIFEALSGLHINMLKSVIYPVNEVLNLEELASILGCSVGEFPATYLGLPLGAKYKSTAIWGRVIEKFEKKLASWKMQYLSTGGRLTLINSVLDSIPTYYMQLFPIPGKVLEQLDKIRRDFLWEGNSEKHKYHLVEWPKVLLPKLQGGLGIKDLALHNKCLLMKWLWRYTQEEHVLWKDVVSAKHGIQSHWCTSLSKAPYGVGVWKHICKLWEKFSQHKHFTVGNGLHIRFWKDKWLRNTVLMDDYPSLFNLARDPDSTISQNRDGTTWSIMFRRNMQDWEFNDLIKLLQTLQSFSLNTQATDQFKWGTTGDGNYTVSAAYKQSRAFNAVTDHWPWKLIWKIKLPPKIVCFCWTALYEACLTQDNLYKRKRIIVNGCYLCQKAAESNRHLFLHCTVTAKLWNMFYSFFGLSWVMPHSIKEAYESWCCWKVDSTIKQTWKMIPAAIFWSIWRERNRRCFEGLSTPLHSLKAECLMCLYSWVNLSYVDSLDSFSNFVGSLVLA